MKKSLFIFLSIILCACLFISCNLDATEGIFRQVVSSEPSSNINIISLIGLSADNNTVYFVAENGIYSRTSGIDTLIRENTEAKQYKNGSLTGTTITALFVNPTGSNNNTSIEVIDTTNPETVNEPTSGKFVHVADGFIVEIVDDQLKVNSVALSTSFVANETKFLSICNQNHAYLLAMKINDEPLIQLFDGTSVKDITVAEDMPNWFSSMAINEAGDILLLGSDGKLYTIATGTTTLVSKKTSYNAQAGGLNKQGFFYDSKYYIPGDTAYASFVLNEDSVTIDAITTGFASGMAVSTVGLRVLDEVNGLVLIATYQNGLYTIDLKNNTKTKI